jgi:hypothetical protein
LQVLQNQNHTKGQVVLRFPYPSKRDAKLREKGLDHFLYTLAWTWLPSPHRPNTAALVARSHYFGHSLFSCIDIC